MSLKANLKRGRDLLMELRGETAAPQPAPPPPSAFPVLSEGEEPGSAYREALRRALTQRAAERLRLWNEEAAARGEKFDYSGERSRLLADYASTCITQAPEAYVERNTPYSLGVVGSEGSEHFLPLNHDDRREVIVDTLARWLWLEKRINTEMPRRVTAYDVRAAADSAMDIEVARVKGEKRGKKHNQS